MRASGCPSVHNQTLNLCTKLSSDPHRPGVCRIFQKGRVPTYYCYSQTTRGLAHDGRLGVRGWQPLGVHRLCDVRDQHACQPAGRSSGHKEGLHAPPHRARVVSNPRKLARGGLRVAGGLRRQGNGTSSEFRATQYLTRGFAEDAHFRVFRGSISQRFESRRVLPNTALKVVPASQYLRVKWRKFEVEAGRRGPRAFVPPAAPRAPPPSLLAPPHAHL